MTLTVLSLGAGVQSTTLALMAAHKEGNETMNFITWPYKLRRGHSDNPAEGACAMDVVSWLAHGRHGDAPACACPVITSYVTVGNDQMPDDVRQRLLPYLHRIAGSRSFQHESIRCRILWLAAVRIFAPRALDAAELKRHAEVLRALPNDVTAAAARAAEWAAEAATAAAAEMAWAAVAATRAAAAEVAAAAATAAEVAAAAATAWDDYFAVLDMVLNAGPQGKPWSADAVEAGAALYRTAALTP